MDTRDKILKISTELIRKGGYNSFSFRDLAQKSGIKSSSVHYYFPTKSDLVVELIKNYEKSFFEKLEYDTRAEVSASKKVLALIKMYQVSLENDLNCLCGALASEIELLSKKEKLSVLSFFDKMQIWIINALKNQKLSSGLDSSELASIVMSSLNGALVLDKVQKSKSKLVTVKKFVEISF